MKFKVFDNKTGKEADPYEIALHEEWAKCLVYCDMEGFAITEDGNLVLMDECGNVVYCDTERFKVVLEDERQHGKWDRGFCSVCGKRSLRTTQTGEIFGIEHTPFCKNCGADMRTKDGQICETLQGW